MSSSILITGAAGKLGTAVLSLMPEAIGATRADFDLSNPAQMDAFLDKYPSITAILHCAAMISPPKINEDITSISPNSLNHQRQINRTIRKHFMVIRCIQRILFSPESLPAKYLVKYEESNVWE